MSGTKLSSLTPVASLGRDSLLYAVVESDGSDGMVSRSIAFKDVAHFMHIVVAASDAPAKAKAMADYICDGVDDHIQILAAIETATSLAGGGVVELSAGTFVGRFAIPEANPYIVLKGAGKYATTLKLPDNAGEAEAAQVLTVAADYTIIRHLGLDGNKDNRTTAANPVAFHRECDGIGVYASWVDIQHCFVKNTKSHGIIVWSDPTPTAANTSRTTGRRQYVSVTYCTISDNGIVNNPRSAIDFADTAAIPQGVWNCEACHNIITGGSHQWGITCHTGSLIRIAFNQIYTAQRAINIHTNATNVTVVGNVIQATAAAVPTAIVINTASRVLCSGNHIIGNDLGGTFRFIACWTITASNQVTLQGNYAATSYGQPTLHGAIYNLAGANVNLLIADEQVAIGGTTNRAMFRIDEGATLTNCRVRGISSSTVSYLVAGDGAAALATLSQFEDVSQFPSKNRIAATIANGNTTVTVAHGMTAWRTLVASDFAVQSLGHSIPAYVTAVSATEVTLTIDSSAGSDLNYIIDGDATRSN